MLEFKGKCVTGIDNTGQAEIQVDGHCQRQGIFPKSRAMKETCPCEHKIE